MFTTELKAAIATKTEIPADCQRLIFRGKHLHPENKTLTDFKITNEASIHLFPRLVSTQPAGNEASASSQGMGSPQRSRILRITRIGAPQAGLYTDYDGSEGSIGSRSIHTTVPEVRLWCYILFFYSFMTLFNHLSFIINTGSTIQPLLVFMS